MIYGVVLMLLVALSLFAGSAIAIDGVGVKSVQVAEIYSAESKDYTKVVYDSDSDYEQKYRNNCVSLGGTFNTCGSYCDEDENCPAVCVYTCENIPFDESKQGYVEGETRYQVDPDLKVKSVIDGIIKVEKSDGDLYTVKVKPSEAVVYAFGSSVPDADVKLEEKTYNNVPSVVYKVDADHEGKFLGIFKIQARYQAAVDASTGDVVEWNGPWWAFLITGEPEKPVVKE